MMRHLPLSPLRARAAPPLPVAQMLRGMPVEEAADLLPRVFNLCRVAQGLAARAAFGLPIEDGWQGALRQEILREHIAKLCIKWPALMSRPGPALPRNWIEGSVAARTALFGETGALPQSYAQFEAFLHSNAGVAPILGAIAQLFPAGTAQRESLPLAQSETVFGTELCENSVAIRHAHHPVLTGIEQSFGRGPVWSATAVAYDVEAMFDGELPGASLHAGRAVVPAARGLYGVRARVRNGIVTAFERVTPTDHLLAPGGVLAQSLASMPQVQGAALGPLLLSILDPCSPVTLETAREEEAVHA